MAQPTSAQGRTREEQVNDYGAFVEKFKPKKTTDDCITPPTIYNIVADYVADYYGVDKSRFVRPFWPGADYREFDYPEGCIVVDNPPFSILSKIYEFYFERGIKFFLFAPTLTLLSGRKTIELRENIVCGERVTYENGAVVPTSFAANMGSDIILRTAPDLAAAIRAENDRLQKQGKTELPKYDYPANVTSAALLQKLCKRGVAVEFPRDQCTVIRKLDSQAELGKAIFGAGLLLSDRCAELQAQAQAQAQAQKPAIIWELSERERAIIEGLNGNAKR